MRSRRWRIAMLLFAVVLGALEIGGRVLTDRSSTWNFRLGGMKRFDPVSYFRLKSDYTITDGVVTNENGFLAPRNLALAKPADRLRLIYVGDSVSVIPAPGMYPSQVEQILTGEGMRVETLNAAVPGYSTENARALFESEVSRYDADWLFVYLGWNDLGQFGPEGMPYKRHEAGYHLNPVQEMLTHVYAIRLLYGLRQVASRYEESVDHPLSEDEEHLYGSYYPQHYEDNLRAILTLAKQRYPNVVIMNLATITNDHPTASELMRAHYPTGMDKNMRKLDRLVAIYNDVVAKVAAELQIPMIDLHALFDSEAARLDFTDSCHLNRDGAARIARAVADFVQQREERRPGQ